MYDIKQACELTGISKDMIRYYEKLGLIVPKRKSNNYRDYSDDDLLRLVMIRFLSNLGISLKTLVHTFYNSDVDHIVHSLRQEAAQLEMLQKHIAAKAEATRLSLHCFEQYAANTPYTFLTVQRRYLFSRNHHTRQAYAQLCSRITQVDGFYQYYYLQSVDMVDGTPRLQGQDLGILLYDPLPFELPGAIELTHQLYYQSSLSLPCGKYLNAEDLLPHLRVAASRSELTRFCVLTYQLFGSNANAPGNNVICLEIPLESTPYLRV